MPFTFKNSQKAVAAFFLFGVLLLLAIMILIGKGSDVFTFKDTYFTYLEEGYSMTAGMAIKFKGFNVGKIKKLTLTPDERIRADVWILSDYRKLVRVDSVLKVQSSLLGGATLVLLPSLDPKSAPQPFDKPMLSSDDEKGQEIMAKLAEQNPNKSDLTASAKKVLDQVVDLMPVINSTLLNLRDSTGSIKTILGGLKGTDTSAVSDKLLITLENIKLITKNVKDLTDAVNSKDNTVGAILYDNKALYRKIDSMLDSVDKSLKNVSALSDKFKDTPDDIKTLTSLLKDNLIELKKVLTGAKNLLGGEKETDKTIKSGDRN